MWTPQPPICGPYYSPKDLHQAFIPIILAKDVLQHSSAHQDLPQMPARQIYQSQIISTFATTNSRPGKHVNPCGLLWPNIGSWKTPQIHSVHHWCIYRICIGHSNWKQRSRNHWKASFSEWFCIFGLPTQIHTNGQKEFVINILRNFLNSSYTSCKNNSGPS